MPCDTRIPRGMTPERRLEQIKVATARLEQWLDNGAVTVAISKDGAIAFVGWQGAERRDVTDVCAYRRLVNEGSFALRKAVAKAEMLAGRKVNQQAIAAGTHSHDGGQTWHPGH